MKCSFCGQTAYTGIIPDNEEDDDLFCCQDHFYIFNKIMDIYQISTSLEPGAYRWVNRGE